MRLNQVTVGAVDLERSVTFYETLGFSLIVKNDHYLRFECPSGDATFSVEQVTSVSRDEEITLYFECDDLDATYRDLVGKGVSFDLEPTERQWLWREALLTDPDGHRLCLYRAGENRRFPPWRLDANA